MSNKQQNRDRDNIDPAPGSTVRAMPAVENADIFLMKVERVDEDRRRCYGPQVDKDGKPTGDYRGRGFDNIEVIN